MYNKGTLIKFLGWKETIPGVRVTPMDVGNTTEIYKTNENLKKGSFGIILKEHHFQFDEEGSKRWLVYWTGVKQKIWTYEREMKLTRRLQQANEILTRN